MLNRVTLDSFFAGPDGEIDWFVPDPELEKELIFDGKAGKPVTILFGRTTYEMFEGYWPKVAKGEINLDYSPEGEEAQAAERKMASLLTQMKKLVFSKTLKEVNWKNTSIVSSELTGEVKKLKKENGGDIIIFGSGTIVQQLTNEGLIDEYIFILTPVILGAGKALFEDVTRNNLMLLEAKAFASGNALLRYNSLK